MAARTQDLTRARKTYSFYRQSPIDIIVNAKSRDITRFRKTYTPTRQNPVAGIIASDAPIAPEEIRLLLTEAGDNLVTEAGDNLTTEG